MKCADFELLVALDAEGDLDAIEKRRLDHHLQLCRECRSLAAELRESQTAFKALRQEMAPPEALSALRERVMASVDGTAEANGLTGWVLALERLWFAGFRRRTALAGIAVFAVLSGLAWYIVAVTGPGSAGPDESEVAAIILPPPPAAAPAPLADDVVPPRAEVEMREPERSAAVPPQPETQSASLERGADLKAAEFAESEPEPAAAPPPLLAAIDAFSEPARAADQILVKLLTDDPNVIIYWVIQPNETRNGG